MVQSIMTFIIVFSVQWFFDELVPHLTSLWNIVLIDIIQVVLDSLKYDWCTYISAWLNTHMFINKSTKKMMDGLLNAPLYINWKSGRPPIIAHILTKKISKKLVLPWYKKLMPWYIKIYPRTTLCNYGYSHSTWYGINNYHGVLSHIQTVP